MVLTLEELKSLGNSVFIANFAVEFTRNLYSKKRNRKI